tara:strand:+ start:1255 stop:1422 length:168 start_codon:yes stop_codon:yes gene_type:complete
MRKLMEKFYYLRKRYLKTKNRKKLKLMCLLTKAILEAFFPQKKIKPKNKIYQDSA